MCAEWWASFTSGSSLHRSKWEGLFLGGCKWTDITTEREQGYFWKPISSRSGRSCCKFCLRLGCLRLWYQFPRLWTWFLGCDLQSESGISSCWSLDGISLWELIPPKPSWLEGVQGDDWAGDFGAEDEVSLGATCEIHLEWRPACGDGLADQALDKCAEDLASVSGRFWCALGQFTCVYSASVDCRRMTFSWFCLVVFVSILGQLLLLAEFVRGACLCCTEPLGTPVTRLWMCELESMGAVTEPTPLLVGEREKPKWKTLCLWFSCTLSSLSKDPSLISKVRTCSHLGVPGLL